MANGLHGYRVRYRRRTDWFRVLCDLRAKGFTEARTATVIGVPLTTLRSWKAGGEPAHTYGHDLLELWIDVTGIPLTGRPMTTG